MGSRLASVSDWLSGDSARALAAPLLPSDAPACSEAGTAASSVAGGETGNGNAAASDYGGSFTSRSPPRSVEYGPGTAAFEVGAGSHGVGSVASASGGAEADSISISLAEASSAPRARLPLLDNAKAALIFLVVMYHTMVVYTSADRPEAPIPLWSGVLCVLKPVVMPSFCLISGHLSRSELTKRRAYELCQLVLTYVLFQTLYHFNNMAAYRLAGFPFRALPLQIFRPQTQVVTWFLLALALWRLALPAVSKLRRPLLFSFVLAQGALFLDLGLNYQNMFSFFPYFLLGHSLPPSASAQLRLPVVRTFFALVFVGACATALVFSYTGESYRGGASFEVAFANLTTTYE